jgi:hypothetical protein
MMAPKPVADCPVVVRASAWVDHMPKVGSGSREMIVAVKLDDDRPWLLTQVPSADPTVRSLELSPGGSAVPGNASFREQVSHDMPGSVSITCGDRELTRIDKITITM